jgi:hypothetical protein
MPAWHRDGRYDSSPDAWQYAGREYSKETSHTGRKVARVEFRQGHQAKGALQEIADL